MLTTTAPDVHPNKKYGIMQTCKLLGIDYKTLVSYTKNKEITAKWRTTSVGTKLKCYLGKDILKFWLEH